MITQYSESEFSKRYRYYSGDQVGEGDLLAECSALETSFERLLNQRGHKYYVVDTCPLIKPRISKSSAAFSAVG